MKPRISMITLGVSDLARATAFYHDGLGLPTQDGFTGITFFKLNGTWLALYPHEKLAIDAQVDSNGQGFQLHHLSKRRPQHERYRHSAVLSHYD